MAASASAAAISEAKTARQTSCGVLVSDGARLLLGHATRSPRWDIPKGIAEPGEAFVDAAARELFEETGLAVAPAILAPLGRHAYLPGKDLALFLWLVPAMPEPAGLSCTSHFRAPDGAELPEFDRFGVFPWEEALSKLGKNMRRVLFGLRGRIASGASE